MTKKPKTEAMHTGYFYITEDHITPYEHGLVVQFINQGHLISNGLEPAFCSNKYRRKYILQHPDFIEDDVEYVLTFGAYYTAGQQPQLPQIATLSMWRGTELVMIKDYRTPQTTPTIEPVQQEQERKES